MPGLSQTLLSVLLFLSWIAKPVFAENQVRSREDVNREVIETYTRMYLEDQDYVRAEEVISGYLSAESGSDAVLWVRLGEVQMARGNFAQACHSFQTGAQKSTETSSRVYASYLLANCYNRGHRPDEAKRILLSIVSDAAPLTGAVDLTLQGFDRGLIRSGDALPPYNAKVRSQFRLSAAFGTGFDSNVLLVEEDVARGSSPGQRASFFLSPTIQGGYVGRVFKDKLDTRIYTTFTDYTNSAVSSFNSLYSRADAVYGSGPVRWGWFGDALFMNRNPFGLYSWESGLSYSFLKEVSDQKSTTFDVPLQFQKYVLPEGTATSDDRTGADLKLRLTKRWMSSDQDFLSLQMGLDGQYSTGANYRMVGVFLPGYWMTALPWLRGLGILNTFNAELRGQYYLQSDTLRRDLWMKVGTGLARSFGSSWNLSIDYSAQKNVSTVSAARYSKEIIAMELTHDFI